VKNLVPQTTKIKKMMIVLCEIMGLYVNFQMFYVNLKKTKKKTFIKIRLVTNVPATLPFWHQFKLQKRSLKFVLKPKT